MVQLLKLARQFPRVAASLSLGGKYLVADLAVQVAAEVVRERNSGDEVKKRGSWKRQGHRWGNLSRFSLEAIDPVRSLSFLVFGLLYGGPINYRVFALYERVVGAMASGRLSGFGRGAISRRWTRAGMNSKWTGAATMTAMDVGIRLPLVFMPTFYVTQSAIHDG